MSRHWINYKERDGRGKGLSGRIAHGGVFIWGNDDSGVEKYRVEWLIPSHFFGLEYEIDEMDSTWRLSIHTLLFSLWVHGQVRPRVQRSAEWGFSVHNGKMHVTWGQDPDCWSRDDPWYQRFTIDPMKIVFGKTRHEKVSIEKTRVLIPLPEGEYAAELELFESRWTRPRWPFTRRMRRVEIDLEEPIPIPGKAENSWDIDDDAVYSSVFPAKTIPEAVNGLRDSVLNTRERYATRDWQPS